MRWWTLAIFTIGCGRIGFSELGSGGPTDSNTANDGTPTDSTPAACLSNPAYVVSAGLTSRYKQVATDLSWLAAKTACEADGAYLTILDDQAETDALIVGDWVGLTDDGNEGVWKTVFGDPAPFEPWGIGQPSTNTTENCARLDDTTQEIEARDCAEPRDYTCECS